MQSKIELSASTNARLIAYAAGAGAAIVPALSHAAVVTVTPASPIVIGNTIDGVYLNVVTGVTGTTGATGWDINPYNNGAGLTFYGSASPAGVLATGTAGTTAVAQSLNVGDVVSPTPAVGFYNQFQTLGTAFSGTPGTKYLGFKFLNEATSVYDYGYLKLSIGSGTGTSAGFPASILSYSYENTGAAITVAGVPEPTLALSSLALGALGIRRRRAAMAA